MHLDSSWRKDLINPARSVFSWREIYEKTSSTGIRRRLHPQYEIRIDNEQSINYAIVLDLEM
jgi:hypothetical protein